LHEKGIVSLDGFEPTSAIIVNEKEFVDLQMKHLKTTIKDRLMEDIKKETEKRTVG